MPNSKMPVGKSSRTPVKHGVMKPFIGSMSGIVLLENSSVFAKLPFGYFDLTAGDGLNNVDSGTCSSEILVYNHRIALARKGPDASRVVLYERQAATFELLKNRWAGEACVELRNGDSRDFDLSKEKWVVDHPRCNVIIVADPNSVATNPITKRCIESLTETSLMFVTLGCNASGMKMSPVGQRNEWWEPVELLWQNLPRWHDVILIKLNRDSHQWLYVIRVPRKLSEQTEQRTIRYASKEWLHGIETASLLRSRTKFMEMLEIYRYTRTEFKNRESCKELGLL